MPMKLNTRGGAAIDIFQVYLSAVKAIPKADCSSKEGEGAYIPSFFETNAF